MSRTELTLDHYIAELNRRLREHPKYREGMIVTRDPIAAEIGGQGSFTFTWPKGEGDETQAFFDAREAVFDIELDMREQYVLEQPEALA